MRAVGITQGLRDTVVNLNERHLSKRAETIYEALESHGLTTAAINITCYRGRYRHLPTIPGAPAVNGPKRFFFYSLYESDRTGAPIAVRNRALGSIDGYAAAVGRWLVTRDGVDLLVYYLPAYGDDPRALADPLDGDPPVDVTLFLDDGEMVARHDGVDDVSILDAYPDGRVRAEAALRNPNAGEVLVSAAEGYEFVDLAGRHHRGGGSHGSLAASDSEVPMLTVGLGDPPGSIVGIKPLLLDHFGVSVARAA